MNENPFGTGAEESIQDHRTIPHSPDMAVLYETGGVDYLPTDIENQHRVGICTAISLTQNQGKANNKKYSADFQYLLQKKFYDLAWYEGSSLLNALKVGKKYGFLPNDLWTHTTEADRSLPYSEYVAKLQNLSDAEINRLLVLCVDNLKGYAQVNVNDSMAVAKAINDSKAGIICRYAVDKNWWTDKNGNVSYKPEDINPLRAPTSLASGHAITMSKFDYTLTIDQILSNTWGTDWDKQGNADVDYSNYRMTEAWLITDKIYFLQNLKLGDNNDDVKRLQVFLNNHGFSIALSGPGSPGNETSYFGLLTQKALIRFQTANNISPTGFFGPITRTLVNSML